MKSSIIALLGYTINYATHRALGEDIHWMVLGLFFASCRNYNTEIKSSKKETSKNFLIISVKLPVDCCAFK